MNESTADITRGPRDEFHVARFKAASRMRVRSHGHDCWHVFLLLSGALEEAAADGGGVSVRAGTIRISPPSARHDIDYAAGENDCVVLHLKSAEFAKPFSASAFDDNVFLNDESLRDDLEMACGRARDPARYFSSPLEIMRWLTNAVHHARVGEALARPTWLEEAHFMIETGGAGVGIERLAERVGVSREHFARVFKRHYGYAPSVLRQRRLLDRAVDMRVNQQAPLSEASLEAGFFDQSHFTNAFTRAAGVSPARFFAAVGA